MDIQTTADGSQTLFVPSLDEHYHSIKGALTESLHIFIKMGLQESKAEEPRILEIGFGTGLNALLTAGEAEKDRTIRYTTLERYPLSMELVGQLEYPKLVDEHTAKYFLPIHRCKWNEWNQITDNFYLRKIECDFTKLEIKEKYDVIYFDAFAPEKQPEMWSQEIFNEMYDCLDENGILVTYCAKGAVRRMLQAAGFEVERLAGPPGGKREILRGKKNRMKTTPRLPMLEA
ncbi:MAG: tRNA (5-methylaminomethyl-2-thiouridine)(34)-methyltransferase MnmD [Paludibacteraceae bacterium]|nr:tRNA (5-methylaminomethyl-2-thiouridine)(34)-methyltransferase MnmD [Paludibacteraceae bacterium]